MVFPIDGQRHDLRGTDGCEIVFGTCVVFGEEFQVLEQVSVQLSLGQGTVGGVVIAKCLEFDIDVVVFGFFLQHFPGL